MKKATGEVERFGLQMSMGFFDWDKGMHVVPLAEEPGKVTEFDGVVEGG